MALHLKKPVFLAANRLCSGVEGLEKIKNCLLTKTVSVISLNLFPPDESWSAHQSEDVLHHLKQREPPLLKNLLQFMKYGE